MLELQIAGLPSLKFKAQYFTLKLGLLSRLSFLCRRYPRVVEILVLIVQRAVTSFGKR